MPNKPEGWRNKRPDDPKRHSDASRGIKSGRKGYVKKPKYPTQKSVLHPSVVPLDEAPHGKREYCPDCGENLEWFPDGSSVCPNEDCDFYSNPGEEDLSVNEPIEIVGTFRGQNKDKPWLVAGVGADGQPRSSRYATKEAAEKRLKEINAQIKDLPPQFGARAEILYRPNEGD
jgi:hypothetical protein